MLGGLLIVSLLAAGPEVKLAAPGFHKLALSQEQARFFTNHLVTRLSEREWMRVVSSDDISAVIGLERQKELLGCNESATSCIAELAGALGVDGLIVGTVAKVGKSYQLNVKVLDPTAKPLFVYSSQRLPSEEAMLDELNQVAELIAKKLEPLHARRVAQAEVLAKEAKPDAKPEPAVEAKAEPVAIPPPPEVARPAPARPVVWKPWALVGAGAVVAGVSAVAWVNVADAWSKLTAGKDATSTLDGVTARHLRDTGTSWQVAGIAMSAVGGLAVVGGLLWYFLADEPAPAVAIGFDGHGGWAGLTFALP